MKAIALQTYGPADDLRLVDTPDPKVAPGEVLIRVKAAEVNPVDRKLADGYLDSIMDVRFPLVPGWDVAGVVEQAGFDAEEFAVGDEVFGVAEISVAMTTAWEMIRWPFTALTTRQEGRQTVSMSPEKPGDS